MAPPAWLGPSKCKASVSGSPYETCPIMPSKIRLIYNAGWCVTAGKCRRCNEEFIDPGVEVLQSWADEAVRKEVLKENRLLERQKRGVICTDK